MAHTAWGPDKPRIGCLVMQEHGPNGENVGVGATLPKWYTILWYPYAWLFSCKSTVMECNIWKFIEHIWYSADMDNLSINVNPRVNALYFLAKKKIFSVNTSMWREMEVRIFHFGGNVSPHTPFPKTLWKNTTPKS